MNSRMERCYDRLRWWPKSLVDHDNKSSYRPGAPTLLVLCEMYRRPHWNSWVSSQTSLLHGGGCGYALVLSLIHTIIRGKLYHEDRGLEGVIITCLLFQLTQQLILRRAMGIRVRIRAYQEGCHIPYPQLILVPNQPNARITT
ncbi:hypothetical protein F5B21DRAFT_483835 [Xylaria acuta]|nr:hypothetical protein F5B21DRAFT_483835 [Xylaria acuta]